VTREGVESGWEALAADPLPWLLDPDRPNLVARVLVEIVGRPANSPAVRRARGGANAVDPVASLLAPLDPDGRWNLDQDPWSEGVGPAWRIIAAAQLGADPEDPRLRAAVIRWLEDLGHDGPLAVGDGGPGGPTCWRTARAVHALCELGWSRHLRVQEGLAWLEDGAPVDRSGGWSSPDGGECGATAAAVLRALAATEGPRRARLFERARGSADRLLHDSVEDGRWGAPRFAGTDVLELLWAVARCDVPWHADWSRALSRVQHGQDGFARWSTRRDLIDDLPLGEAREPEGSPSGWLTLEGVGVLLAYAVPAGLPRRFPHKPGP
jgi:hypothetical protein